MLRIITSKSVGQAKKYYSDGLTREGYYSEGQEMAGQWGGQAALKLGLTGSVQKGAFQSLCDNIHPATGEPLTPRMKKDRRVGYDMNFHAPKSVTLAYEWLKDKRILQTFRKAVQETMEELEREAATRVRTKGRDEDRITGNLVWAEFIHFTARPVHGVPDPHLHAHCYTFNATYDEQESRWKAAQIGDIKRDASYYEAAFRARLAMGLKELGYEIEPVGGSFELAGISRSLIEKFSRRTAVVEAEAERRGAYTAGERDGLAALTREKKAKNLSNEDLDRLWRKRLSAEDIKELNSLGKGLMREHGQDRHAEALAFAMAHVFERLSAASEKQFFAEALRWGYGDVTIEGIKKAAQKASLLYYERDGRLFVTTEEVLAEEQRIVDLSLAGKGRVPAINPSWRIQDERLNPQQREAVSHVLSARDSIIGIAGKAGTGKTTLLQEAAQGINASGQKLLVLAPTAETARVVLRKEGFRNAETVAQLLASPHLQESSRGAVWWVDEAGLLSSPTMGRLLDLSEKLGARVVLVGDTGQHHSVERGSPFDLLARFGGMSVAGVDKIQRQRGTYREAVELISEHKYDAALEKFKAMGAVHEIEDAHERHKAIAADYVAAVKEGKTALVVSPTHAECNDVTHEIRQALKEQNAIKVAKQWETLRQLAWTRAERSDARRYSPGLVVRITQPMKGFQAGEQAEVVTVGDLAVGDHFLEVRSNDGKIRELPLSAAKRFSVYEKGDIELCRGDRIRITTNGRSVEGHRLNNSSIHTIKGFSRKGEAILDNGWRLGKDFGHLNYGYASTSYTSQGKTVDRVFVSQSGYSSVAADANQFYVSVSRGREFVDIYTDDFDMLRSAVSRERERPNAMELKAEEHRRQPARERAHKERSPRAAKEVEVAERKPEREGEMEKDMELEL